MTNKLQRIFNRARQEIWTARYTRRKILPVRYQGLDFKFAIENSISRDWFFPRYADGSVHEPAICKLLVDALQPDSIFLDIGANLGFFTILASQICKSGSVHAFEVDPQIVCLIHDSLKLNEICGSVIVNCAAVTQHSGSSLSFRPHQAGNPSTNQLLPQDSISDGGYEIRVPTISVDEYVNNLGLSPDMIKMDIEGAEALAVDGMLQTLSTHKPDLVMELHPKQLNNFNTESRDIIEKITQIGYSGYSIEDHRDSDGGFLRKIDERTYLRVENYVLLFRAI